MSRPAVSHADPVPLRPPAQQSFPLGSLLALQVARFFPLFFIILILVIVIAVVIFLFLSSPVADSNKSV